MVHTLRALDRAKLLTELSYASTSESRSTSGGLLYSILSSDTVDRLLKTIGKATIAAATGIAARSLLLRQTSASAKAKEQKQVWFASLSIEKLNTIFSTVFSTVGDDGTGWGHELFSRLMIAVYFAETINATVDATRHLLDEHRLRIEPEPDSLQSKSILWIYDNVDLVCVPIRNASEEMCNHMIALAIQILKNTGIFENKNKLRFRGYFDVTSPTSVNICIQRMGTPYMHTVSLDEVRARCNNAETFILCISASWCPPCQRLAPFLRSVASRPQTVPIFAVYDDDIFKKSIEFGDEIFELTTIPCLVHVLNGRVRDSLNESKVDKVLSFLEEAVSYEHAGKLQTPRTMTVLPQDAGVTFSAFSPESTSSDDGPAAG